MKVLNLLMVVVSLLYGNLFYGADNLLTPGQKHEITELSRRLIEQVQLLQTSDSSNDSPEVKKLKDEVKSLNMQIGYLEGEYSRMIIIKNNNELLEEKNKKLEEDLKNEREKLKHSEDNKFLSWSEMQILHARHIWAAITTASAVACAGTSYLLSKADTKSSPVLAVAAGGTGLFTLAGMAMTGKKRYVYNQAFDQTKIKSIESPADQRKLLKKIKDLDGQTSVASYLFYLNK